MSDQIERAERFAALHRSAGAFIVANPWDAGSARLLAGLGFEALASTSWGAAIALGQADGEVSRETMIEHVRQLSAATDLPLSADLENCYAHDPREAAPTLLLAAGAGAVGGSIEDYSGDLRFRPRCGFGRFRRVPSPVRIQHRATLSGIENGCRIRRLVCRDPRKDLDHSN